VRVHVVVPEGFDDPGQPTGGNIGLGGEICLILPPAERTCRRLSQDVASPQTLRDRKVTNTKSAR